MSQNNSIYRVKYINCKVCGSDGFKLLGVRGNLEYLGAQPLEEGIPHMITNVVKCRNCGFVYTNPHIISDIGTCFYNNPDCYLASCYGKEEKLFKETLSLLEGFSKKGRLLDVGAGKGEFLNLAKESGWEAYGVEISGELASCARQKFNLNIETKPIEEAKYPGGYFDAVTLNMALEHIDEPNDAIKEISRVLNENGVLFIEVPNMDSLLLKIISLYFTMTGKSWSPLLSPMHKPFHSYGYSVSTLKFLLNKHSFRVVKVANGNLFGRGIEEKPDVKALFKIGASLAMTIGGILGMGDVIKIIAMKRSVCKK